MLPDNPSIGAVFPNFSATFEQLAKYEPSTNAFKHYVGNPKFDDFTTLEYGIGYQLYCKSSSPVTITFKGKLPATPFSKALTAGWHLLPATGLTATATSSAFSGLTYDQVLSGPSLTSVTQVQPGQAYYVRLTAAGTWTPPLPKDVTTRFVYDGDGGRVKQTTSAGTTLFIGQSYEKDPTGKTTKYVFAGSERIAAKDSTGALRFYHTDHLGSSNVITDSTGAVVEVAEYTPYGSLSSRSGSVNVAHKFTGQRSDASTGLYFYNARYYDPQLGRFISPDPFVQNPSDPQTLNRYAYCRNNPINLVDPSGHGWLRKLFSIVAAIVATVLMPEGSGIWWSLAAASVVTAAAVAGDQVGAAIERRADASSAATSSAASPQPGPPAALLGPSIMLPTISLRPTGPFVPMNAGSPPRYSAPPPPNTPQIEDILSVILTVAEIAFLAYGMAAGAAPALGEAGTLTLRQATSRVALEEARSLQQAGLQMSSHAADRMVEYGVNKKMLETALRVGQRFWDPLNRSIVHVLEEGFASGRSLLVAQNPVTRVIKTVIADVDLIRRRFIPF